MEPTHGQPRLRLNVPRLRHLNRSLLGSFDLAPSDSVPVTNRVPVGPEIHASLLRLFALPNEPAANKTAGVYTN